VKTLFNRWVFRIIALVILAFAVITKRIQLWLFITLFSILLSFYFGRFFCGYLCPTNTFLRVLNFRKKHPITLGSEKIRFVVLFIFLTLMFINMRLGAKFPFIIILTAVGILFSLFISERAWHKYFCPYGTLMSIISRKYSKGIRIDSDKCISCGICQKVCPTEGIDRSDNGFKIIKSECLDCSLCKANCSVNAIN